MNINVLNPFYKKTVIVDNYISLMWCKRYADVGALDLEVEASKENIETFKKNFYITRDDDDAIYRIEKIELDTDENGDDKLIIGAIDMKELLHQRITWSQVFMNNSDVQTFIKQMLNFNFIAPQDTKRRVNLRFDDNTELDGIGTAATRQSTYDDIGEKVIELCKTYNLGCKIYFDYETQKFHFKMFNGVNRSAGQTVNPRIVFSSDNDNLFSSKYEFDMSELKNVALVGGEGEGVDRKLRSVGNVSGLERREIFIDASKAKDDGDLVDYYNALENEGKSKLTELTAKSTFDADVDTNFFKYKTDYDLGDVVTIQNRYGVAMNARIVEIIETWDKEGYTIEPKFEYIEDSDDVKNVLLTEFVDMMLTEIDQALLYETSPTITENGNDYIITEDNKQIVLEV